MKKKVTYELVKELIMKPFRSEDDIKIIKEWFDSLTWGEPICYRTEEDVEILKKRSKSSSSD